MIKLKTIVESKFQMGQHLYHYTTMKRLYKMLKENEMRVKQYVEAEKKYSFSFSRSKQWLYDTGVFDKIGVNSDCAVVFDAYKLSTKFKMKPYSFFNEFGKDKELGNKTYHEFEERILIDSNIIPNIRNYIVGIYVSKKYIVSLSKNDFISLISSLTNFSHSDFEFSEYIKKISSLFDDDHNDTDKLHYVKTKLENDLGIEVTII